jgi:hypothetical protein
MSTLTIPQLELASSSPATKKTNGPVMSRAANHSESSAHPMITAASTARVDSFMRGNLRPADVTTRPSCRANSALASQS